MPPNIGDPPMQTDPESVIHGKTFKSESEVDLVPRVEENFKLKVFQSSLNLLAHTLIGAVVGISILYAFRNGLPLGSTPLHVVLCVVGYHLLMAQAILSLSPHNGWSSNLKLVDKRRAHWILQILGSGLAIVGSFIKILDKTVHWDTLHGQFALVALVFTIACFFNGLTSNYAYELRSFIPSNLSKLTHICFGTVAFSAACIALCYGFDKVMFKNWITIELSYTAIAFTATFAAIIIINPLITLVVKLVNVNKK